MRRRLFLLVVSAVLAASLAASSFGADVRSFSMKLGTAFTITGRTGSVSGTKRALGTVVVSGRWGSGPWHVITKTSTDKAGNYHLTVKPRRRGNLTLRISPPDHHPRRYLLHVS